MPCLMTVENYSLYVQCLKDNLEMFVSYKQRISRNVVETVGHSGGHINKIYSK